VLVLTASREPRLEERALELGASAFLTKPEREATLVEALRTVQIRGKVRRGPRGASSA
jgi:DNA-binding NarL/FixJ family response regulator